MNKQAVRMYNWFEMLVPWISFTLLFYDKMDRSFLCFQFQPILI